MTKIIVLMLLLSSASAIAPAKEIAGSHLTIRVESWSKTTLTGAVSVGGTTIDGTWRGQNGSGRFTAARQ
jgi:hypothetical protein